MRRLCDEDVRMTIDESTLTWYVLHTRSRFEKRVAAELTRRGVIHFLPLVPTVQQWKDRRKTVWFPLFPGYVFIRSLRAGLVRASRIRGVVRLLGISGRPTPIPDAEIEGIRRLLAEPGGLESEPYFEAGDLVEVTDGALVGVRGRLLHRHGRQRLVVSVELIRQAVSIEIDRRSVRRLRHGAERAGNAERHIA